VHYKSTRSTRFLPIPLKVSKLASQLDEFWIYPGLKKVGLFRVSLSPKGGEEESLEVFVYFPQRR
jgi:hypothetical protein